MKKVLFGLMLGLAGMLSADTRFSWLVKNADELMQGDGFTKPVSAATNDSIYWTKFKGNTVATMAAVTGVSLTANIKVPTSVKPGGTMTLGVTVTYNGVTNSAVLSATAKVQLGGYQDYGGLTTTAVSVSPQIQLTSVANYGGPNQVELFDISGVYPGSIVQVYIERIAGTNQTLHFWEVWAKCEPARGWFGF